MEWMKNKRVKIGTFGWLLLLPVISLALGLCGCQRQTADEIDFGGITNSVYQNTYFGMSVTIPADWSIQDQTRQRELEATGSKMLYGDDPNKEAIVKASELKIVNMFAVFEYPLGSPVPFNPSVIALAENVREYPGIKTGKDYLYHAKQALMSGQMQFSFPKPEYSVQLGGNPFEVMPVQMTVGRTTVNQRYYVTIMKGYALSFIESYTSNDQETALQKILNSVAFKPANQH